MSTLWANLWAADAVSSFILFFGPAPDWAKWLTIVIFLLLILLVWKLKI